LYVCVCNAVTEREVDAVIAAGANSIKDLNRELSIGSQCGACVGCAKACLSKTQAQTSKRPPNVFPIAKQAAA